MASLNHTFDLYVPTQCKCTKDLPRNIRNEVYNQVLRKFNEWFSGATVTQGKGIWNTAEEVVDIVSANANVGQYEAFRLALPLLAKEVAGRLTQHAVTFRLDHKMDFASGSTGPCVHEQGQEPPAKSPLDKKRKILAAILKMDGLPTIRELFIDALGYDYSDEVLPFAGWDNALRTLIADGSDPIECAKKGDFRIVYIRLRGQNLRSGERPIVEQIFRDSPGFRGLLLFSDSNQVAWDLINARYKDDKKHAKNVAIRRMHFERGQYSRTAVDRLAFAEIAAEDTDLTPILIQRKLDTAFNVEAVSRDFFRQYRDMFEYAEKSIVGFGKSDKAKNERHLFTQQLFNRLMFIFFIQKKGWLSWNGEKAYLNAIWQDYSLNRKKSSGFYADRLKPLFFNGLNSPAQNSGDREKVIGKVPYLNGGLFERTEADIDTTIDVPDKSIDKILNGLFERFNFTVSESTPLEQDIAVDPEMLGTIFEELVTGRHEQGAYYTPKPVVSFMCQQSLKSFLKRSLVKETDLAISDFVEEHDATGFRDPESVLRALQNIAVCDPACGSGAYLLGMMHELLALREALFVSNRIGARQAYDRKLEIIQSNLFGVDIDPFAINIARLRLWLSLAVEYDSDECPPPLPNLEFKVEVGDSICGPQIFRGSSRGFVGPLISEYADLKARYMRAHEKEKLSITKRISEVREELAGWTKAGSRSEGFDWVVEFAEVFKNNGFDIVIANPPYIRQELIKEQKPILKIRFPDIYHGKADLYCYFYGRGIEILKDGGLLAFISSNKWFRADYGKALRAYIAKSCQVLDIVDFGELPVFENAATFPMIFLAIKGTAAGNYETVLTQVTSLEPPYPDIRILVQEGGSILPKTAIRGGDWTLANNKTTALIKKMDAGGIPLEKFLKVGIHYGIKTGFNEAFIIDDEKKSKLIREDRKSEELIKPLAVGTDIRRWRVEKRNRWLLYMHHDTELDRYPAIKKHLALWKVKLEPKPKNWQSNRIWQGRASGAYKWFQLQTDAVDTGIIEAPKIVYPVIAKEPRFAYDAEGYFLNDKCFFIPAKDFFLLGVLNSSVIWEYLKAKCSCLGDPEKGGRLELRSIYLEKLPIPKASPLEKNKIEALVQECINRRGADCEENERLINEKVTALFGL